MQLIDLDPLMIVGLSLWTRAATLIGLVGFMFRVAGVVITLGRRRREAQRAKALSFDAGTSKGATKGRDATHSED